MFQKPLSRRKSTLFSQTFKFYICLFCQTHSHLPFQPVPVLFPVGDGFCSLFQTFQSLGFCFLGGIFVPLEMLTGVVRRIGQFFPTYWYAQNISILSFNETLTDSLRTTLFQGMGIQLLFALACVAVALAIGRARRQEE